MITREELIDELEYYAQTWMDLQLARSYDGDVARAEDEHAIAEKDVLSIVDEQAARIAELEAVLRQLERAGHDDTDFCRVCYDNKPRHAPDCKLARLLNIREEL